MALTNAQYDEIMRGYDKRQLQNKYIHDKRIEEAYRKAPRLREIDSEIASASVRQAYRLMDGDENALAALRLAIEDYKEERAALLSTLGYPLDYFEPIYTCPDCHDTGYIDGQNVIVSNRLLSIPFIRSPISGRFCQERIFPRSHSIITQMSRKILRQGCLLLPQQSLQ